MPWEALDRGTQLAEFDRAGIDRLLHNGRDSVRVRRSKPRDGTDRAGADPVVDERLRPDEDVEPLAELRRELVERGVRDLEPRQVRRALTQLEQHRHRHRVTTRALELVDVEGHGRTGRRGRLEVIQERTLVELEVRRPD